jgi:hypothetical protein
LFSFTEIDMTPGLVAYATVLICTYQRAALLAETLDSLARTRTTRRWEVLVVDNNSTDDTRAVTESRQAAYPVPLRYVFEPRQGKSHALNRGIGMSAADVIVFTDDDVRVPPEWLDESIRPLDADPVAGYTGGPVRPLWEVPPPSWFDTSRTDLWGPLALVDYGADSFVFEQRGRVPVGANMTVRKALIDRLGGFDPAFGRTGSSLLGQEQAEFLARLRREGAWGVYAPAAGLQHFVPARRLTLRYFSRWWYWKGVSRARMDAIHPITDAGLDLRTVPHWFGAPRFVWGAVFHHGIATLREFMRGERRMAMYPAMHLCYTLGYLRARVPLSWKGRTNTAPAVRRVGRTDA